MMRDECLAAVLLGLCACATNEPGTAHQDASTERDASAELDAAPSYEAPPWLDIEDYALPACVDETESEEDIAQLQRFLESRVFFDPKPEPRCETHAWPEELPSLTLNFSPGGGSVGIEALPPHPDDPSGCPRLQIFSAPRRVWPEIGRPACKFVIAEARVRDSGLSAYQALLDSIDEGAWPENVGTPGSDDGLQLRLKLGEASVFFDVGDPEAAAIDGIVEAVDLLGAFLNELSICAEETHLYLGPLCAEEPNDPDATNFDFIGWAPEGGEP